MPDWCLGADLGTSFSAAAFAVGDRVEVLEVGRERRIPSTVVLDNGRLVAGTLAQRLTGRAPERAERNPKRYVGRGPMLLGGSPVEARDAMAALLELFVTEGRTRFDGAEPVAVVLTHPVAWDEARRTVLAEAAKQVVPKAELCLETEPAAAAVHYAATYGLADGGRVAVYDLGGGTFDSAVLATNGSGFTVIGRPGGDDEVGGESFDERVYAHFGEQLAERAPQWWEQVISSPERRWLAAAADLLTEARAAKETLSEYDTASQYISGADVDVEISRAELEDLIGADVIRTAETLDETIRQADGKTSGLAGIFLTGGASRIPLVGRTLRARHGDLVRTWDDPKIVVALGAARLAAARRTRPASTTPAAPAVVKTDPDQMDVRLEGVLEARGGINGVYAWCVGTRHTLHRVDPDTGAPDQQLVLGNIADWAVADQGLLVANLDAGQTWAHALTPELVIRSSRSVNTGRAPVVLAQDGVGWAFLAPRPPVPVGNQVGLPWGETGGLSVVEISLTGVFMQDSLPTPLGDSARWYVNENNAVRRLLDQDSPTEIAPMIAHGQPGAVVVLGQYRSKAPIGASSGRPGGLTGSGRHRQVVPWQVVCTIRPGGVIEKLERHGGNWLHQAVHHNGEWHLATSAGLEIGPPAGEGTKLAARPRAGAVRWFPAGERMYAVGVEQVVPSRGVWVAVLENGQMRSLVQEPRSSLLGHLTSTTRSEAPRIVADGDTLWVAATREAGRSVLLHATPDGVRTVRSAPGWLEPVARIPSGLLCLHAAETAPGENRPSAARLVHLPI
jgi:actin-like ATPase involved in cell morphogenesis